MPHDYDALDALHSCYRWFKRWSPEHHGAGIDGKMYSTEHPMLVMLSDVIDREEAKRAAIESREPLFRPNSVL